MSVWYQSQDIRTPDSEMGGHSMTKSEFISRLKDALANELNSQKVQEHVNYYSEYISDEVRKGRSEAEVVAELGDPWAIAKNIITSEEIKGGTSEEYSYEPKRRSYADDSEQRKSGPKVHFFGLSWWKVLLIVLGIIGVLMAVVAVIGGLVSIFAPIVVPVVIIWLVIKVLGNNRRR